MKSLFTSAALALAAFCVPFASTAAAQRRASPRQAPPAVTTRSSRTVSDSPEVRRRVESFTKAWSTLNENYFDPSFNNLNWDSIRAEYEPKVRAATSDAQLYALITQMIGRLQRSHLALITPEVYQAIERAKVEAKAREAAIAAQKENAGDDNEPPDAETADADDPLTEYGIGVDVRLIESRFVITRLNPNSAAEAAGLRMGFAIDKINGVSLADLLRRIETANTNTARIKRFLPFEIVSSFLNGEKDSVVEITYSDAGDLSQTVKIKRERQPAQTISFGSTLPPRQLKFESQSINGDVGLIRFNFFGIAVLEKFCNAIREFKTKKAIILDLRGNLGGVLATMIGLGGMLTETKLPLGTSIYRTNSESLAAKSKARNFKGRLAILIDNQTASAAEVFAAAMQDAGRALVVGTRTAGEALPSVAAELPTGAVLLYPIANYRTPAGSYLEGNGVAPDIPVSLSRSGLLAGADEQLNAAVAAVSDDKLFEGNFLKKVEPAAPPPPVAKATLPGAQRAVIATVDAIPPPDTLADGKTPPSAQAPDSGTKLTVKGNGESIRSPGTPAAPPNLPPGKDADSVRIVNDFLVAVGGRTALAAVRSYTLRGQTELILKGSRNAFAIDVFFEKPNKYAEIMQSPSAGEVREVHSTAGHFVQSDYGFSTDLPAHANTGDFDLLGPLRTLVDPNFYSAMRFLGTFDREGRKVNVMDARTNEGYYLALAFDVETKLLISFTGSYYNLNFSDYKKVGNVSLPFTVERAGLMTLKFDEIMVNEPIEPGNFQKKQNCYDQAD